MRSRQSRPIDFRLERIDMVGGGQIEVEHAPEGDRVAERVEEGQHADQDVVRVDVDHLIDAADIGLDIAVGQDRALGVAGRAGGEHDADHVVGSVLMDAEEADQELCRHPEGLRGGNDFVAASGGSPEILEVDDLGVELQRHTLEEGPAGQDVADAGLGDRRVEQL